MTIPDTILAFMGAREIDLPGGNGWVGRQVIARALERDPSKMCGAFRPLVKRGLIECVSEGSGGRTIYRLTDKGRARARELEAPKEDEK